ncbi:MAG: NAD(P)/FAD-dependent oxidoreductase [Acidimicrobiia bacterium]|nr:NAD(P)/FAD-dependent oxidoreductase [Acidimicrobiia bacterium]
MTHRVVIVGAGFAGLNAAKRLRQAPVAITIIDRSNYHLFQPLLYQVATGGLSPADIASPIRYILRRQKNVRVILDTVTDVDVDHKSVTTTSGLIPYDTLIVATGATHHYFGHDEWETSAPGLKTLRDATGIRASILEAFEHAERSHSPDSLNFLVIGGGPTGAEMAGTIAEMARDTLRRDFRAIDPRTARVILVEAGPAVLPAFAGDLSNRAALQLAKLGVEVRTNWQATAISGDSVTMTDGTTSETIHAASIVWAAGVSGSPLGAQLVGRDGLDRSGRVMVSDQLTVPGHPEVFVLGDLAHAVSEARPVPGVAPAAIQAGRYAADTIVDRMEGRTPPVFTYRNKGTMATIGRRSGVAELGKLRLHGWPAWMAWLVVHLWFLIGFENRLLVLTQWAWNYVTRNRSARLIIRYRD